LDSDNWGVPSRFTPAKILDERTANVLNASAQKGAAQFIIE
jgi:hypothetical protein